MRAIVMPVVTFLLAAATLPAAAEDHGIRGWGPRVGLASDPDQVLLGVHLDAGRLGPRVRFQPDVELGVGDDVFVLAFTAPVHYRFRVQGDVHPYAGGGVTIGFVDVDHDHDDEFDHDHDDDVEAAIDITGGLEWALDGDDLFFVEFSILAGDLHDFQLVAGWTF